jgi:hypothetical protein
LYGRAGHLTAQNGGFRPGQVGPLIGAAADAYGRKALVLIAPAVQAGFRLAVALRPSVPLFAAFQMAQVRETSSWPLVHHTTSIDPTKDKSLCSNKVTSENDAESAQKLGLLQPSAFS